MEDEKLSFKKRMSLGELSNIVTKIINSTEGASPLLAKLWGSTPGSSEAFEKIRQLPPEVALSAIEGYGPTAPDIEKFKLLFFTEIIDIKDIERRELTDKNIQDGIDMILKESLLATGIHFGHFSIKDYLIFLDNFNLSDINSESHGRIIKGAIPSRLKTKATFFTKTNIKESLIKTSGKVLKHDPETKKSIACLEEILGIICSTVCKLALELKTERKEILTELKLLFNKKEILCSNLSGPEYYMENMFFVSICEKQGIKIVECSTVHVIKDVSGEKYYLPVPDSTDQK